jgi:hypothetical protein
MNSARLDSSNSIVTARDRPAEWLFNPASRRFALWCVAVSYVLFLVLVNKWIVTDLKLLSFGRVWQFFVSYQDLGFVRRAFIGSILTVLHASSLFQNEYVLAYGIHILAGTVLFLVLSLLVLRTPRLARAHVLSIAFSPSIMHFSMNTGNLDVFIFTIVLIIILMRDNLFAIVLLTVAGVLTHELMLFYIPFVLTALNVQLKNMSVRRNFLSTALVGAAAISSFFIVNVFGKGGFDEDTFNKAMAIKLPIAAGKHAFWSGYFELTSSFRDNVRDAHEYAALLFVDHNWIWLIVPLAYVIMFVVIVFYLKAVPIAWRLAQAASLLFPLIICVIALDYPRWVCMSANLGVLSALTGVGAKMLIIPRRIMLIMLSFCVFAPFGNTDFRRPFPMHQFVIEKLANIFHAPKSTD